jgi:hypothetical protein
LLRFQIFSNQRGPLTFSARNHESLRVNGPGIFKGICHLREQGFRLWGGL